MNLLEKWKKEHVVLEQFLEEHFRFVVRRNWEKAEESWTSFSERLQEHAKEEETRLQPFFVKTPAPLAIGLEVLRGEHEKLGVLLFEIQGHLKNAAESEDPEKAVWNVLFREGFFREVWRHHRLREEERLFPWLEEKGFVSVSSG